MSAAVELREAAALMRSRAEALTAADHVGTRWVASPRRDHENNGWRVDYMPDIEGFDNTLAHTVYDYEGSLAGHLSGWHPVVALAVADWLEGTAVRLESYLDAFAPGSRAGAVTAAENTQGLDEALAVARAYLGVSL